MYRDRGCGPTRCSSSGRNRDHANGAGANLSWKKRNGSVEQSPGGGSSPVSLGFLDDTACIVGYSITLWLPSHGRAVYRPRHVPELGTALCGEPTLPGKLWPYPHGTGELAGAIGAEATV